MKNLLLAISVVALSFTATDYTSAMNPRHDVEMGVHVLTKHVDVIGFDNYGNYTTGRANVRFDKEGTPIKATINGETGSVWFYNQKAPNGLIYHYAFQAAGRTWYFRLD